MCIFTTEEFQHVFLYWGPVVKVLATDQKFVSVNHYTASCQQQHYATIWLHPSIIYSTYPLRVTGKLEPIPDDFGLEVGYRLGRMPGLTQRKTTCYTNFHTHGKFWVYSHKSDPYHSWAHLPPKDHISWPVWMLLTTQYYLEEVPSGADQLGMCTLNTPRLQTRMLSCAFINSLENIRVNNSSRSHLSKEHRL